MSKLRDAAQQALEALESAIPWIVTDRNTFAEVVRARHFQRNDTETDEVILSGYDAVIDDAEKAIAALRAALAEQPAEQEPVAWMCSNRELMNKGYELFSATGGGDWNIPVYTAPQPRRRLTDEEIAVIYLDTAEETSGGGLRRMEAFARAIERAHGIGEHE